MKLFSIALALAFIGFANPAHSMKKNVHPDGHEVIIIMTDESTYTTPPRSSFGHDDDKSMRTNDPIQLPNPKEEPKPIKQTPPAPLSLPSR